MSYPTFLSPIERAVCDKREAQEAKWGVRRHADGTGPTQHLRPRLFASEAAVIARRRTDENARRGEQTWAQILLEEVRDALAEENPQKLRTERAFCHGRTGWLRSLSRSTVVVTKAGFLAPKLRRDVSLIVAVPS